MHRFHPFAALLLIVSIADALPAETRGEKVRADRKKVEAQGFWIYNDLDKAYQSARETGKPILVSMRCIPCEECVKLDDDLIDNDPAVRPLLDQFVCVRVVGTNGLDLNTFQYDTDQSFAMFMLNADKTIYGRFGTRSHRTEWLGDVSLSGLAEALSGALVLHKNLAEHRDSLAGKRGKQLEFSSPEQYPALKKRYTSELNYDGDVVASCIHCHQIGDARYDYYWNQSKSIPEKLLFPYPHPKSIGLILDPNKRARVKAITPESFAAQTTLQPGDDILRINEQPILSMADVQWVLHHTSAAGDELELVVQREKQIQTLSIKLPQGWRRLDNPRWRVSSWGLTIMTLGGLRLQPLSDQEREQYDVPSGMALRASYVGWYSKQGAAKLAGIVKDDILIEYDGRTDFEREADVYTYAFSKFKPGDNVQIKYLRNGKIRTATLPIQRR